MSFKETFLRIFLLLIVFCWIGDSGALIKSGLCSPYFVSIKSDRVNSHRGPGKEYKIRYEYIQKGTPLLVIAKYDHWRKVRDCQGDEGWIHKSLLSSKRFVITTTNTPSKLMKEPLENSKTLALVAKNVVMELISASGNWCKVILKNNKKEFKGWIKKIEVFGVFENEIC